MKPSIITPEKIIFSDDVDQATIPTTDGEITVLPHHIPLVGLLKAGELIIKKGDEVIPLAVSLKMVSSPIFKNQKLDLTPFSQRDICSPSAGYHAGPVCGIL